MTQNVVYLGEYSRCIWGECILLLFDILPKYQLNLVERECYSFWLYACWFSASWFCQLLIGGVLRSPTIIMDLFISPCSSNSFYFKYFDALYFWGYTLKMIMSSWRIWSSYHYATPLFIWHSVVFQSLLCLNLIQLLQLSVDWSHVFLHSFIFNPSVCLYLKLVSYRQVGLNLFLFTLAISVF